MNDIRTNTDKIRSLVDETITSRNLTMSTRRSYHYHLSRIFSTMDNDKICKGFHAAARAYLVGMENNNLSTSSIIKARAAINIAIEVITDAENENKTWRIFRRKTRRKLQKVVSSESIIALQRAVRTPLEEALLAIALTTGLRKSEIMNLRISDLQRDPKQIFIKEGKGCKDRLIEQSCAEKTPSLRDLA